MRFKLFLYIFSFLFVAGSKQTVDKDKEASFLVERYLLGLSKDIIYLDGFDGFSTCRIDSFAVKESGYFQLRYDSTIKGVGYLISSYAIGI